MKYHNTIRLFNLINRNLFQTIGNLWYTRLVQTFIVFANVVNKEDYEDDFWSIGEFETADIGSVLEGAYWFFSDYHSGQFSDEYKALCAIGKVFSHGRCSNGVDPDNFGALEVYEELERMLNKTHRKMASKPDLEKKVKY